MIQRLKINFKEIFPNGKFNSNKSEYITNCPWCNKENHFYINSKTYKYDCKKCGKSGNIFSLLKKIDKLYLLDGISVNIIDIKSINEIEEQDEEIKYKDEKNILLPIGCKLALNNEYLFSRGLTNIDIINYDIRTTDMLSRFYNYIIFPIYQNKQVKAFVARYASKVVPEDKLRYNNSVQKFSKFLYGIDNIKNGDSVIIVEGIFDKISLEKKIVKLNRKEKVVCSFGNKVSEEQIYLLKSKKIEKIGLLFDRDAIKNSKTNSTKLENHFDVKLFFPVRKDIDLCNLEETQNILNNPYSVYGFFVNQIESILK